MSQLNQLKAKPDNEDCNTKFLRALPHSWSQVCITLKTRGGLEFLTFDDLYNKLRALEIDIKGYSTYTPSAAPSNSTFVSTTTSNKKVTYVDSPSPSSTTSSYTSTTPKTHSRSSNVLEDVLHSFVADYEPQQQLAFEDFEQVDKLDLDEMDLKWQMAMLSVKIKRFERKAGRKLNFRGRDPARFDRKKVKCYTCCEMGHFSRECTVKNADDKTRYSAYKQKELESGNSKAMVFVDSMVDRNEHDSADMEGSASKLYGMLAGYESEDESEEFALMGISSQVQNCIFGCNNKYADLKKEFDDLETQYNDSYIQVQAYKGDVKH